MGADEAPEPDGVLRRDAERVGRGTREPGDDLGRCGRLERDRRLRGRADVRRDDVGADRGAVARRGGPRQRGLSTPGHRGRRGRRVGHAELHRRCRGASGGPCLFAFFAATQNVYVMPLASPVTVSVVLFELNVIGGRATAPTYGVTTYATMAEPLLAGAAHDTVARALPATADRIAGAAGTPTLHRVGRRRAVARALGVLRGDPEGVGGAVLQSRDDLGRCLRPERERGPRGRADVRRDHVGDDRRPVARRRGPLHRRAGVAGSGRRCRRCSGRRGPRRAGRRLDRGGRQHERRQHRQRPRHATSPVRPPCVQDRSPTHPAEGGNDRSRNVAGQHRYARSGRITCEGATIRVGPSGGGAMERPGDWDASALSRRAVLRGLGALVAGSALAACAPGGSKASPPPLPERARLTSIVVRKPGSLPNPTLPTGTDTMPQIEHIVVLMMENHSFDDHFGMLERGDGFKLGSDGLPLDANPYTDGKLLKAFHMPSTCQLDSHPGQDWNASHTSYDNGRNDGFVKAQRPGRDGLLGRAPTSPSTTASGRPSRSPIATSARCWRRRIRTGGSSSRAPRPGIVSTTSGVAARAAAAERHDLRSARRARHHAGRTTTPTCPAIARHPDGADRRTRRTSPKASQFVTDAAAGKLPVGLVRRPQLQTSSPRRTRRTSARVSASRPRSSTR